MVQLHVPDRCISWGPILRIRCVTNLKDIYRRDGARAVLVLVWFAALVSATPALGSRVTSPSSVLGWRLAARRGTCWTYCGAATSSISSTYGGGLFST